MTDSVDNPSGNSSFATIAGRLRPVIEDALDQASRLGPGCPPKLMAAIRYGLLAPGKRLRPMLTLMAAEACGCHYSKAISAACAVEMIHAYSLIHDDLPAMDDDDLRRGRPTCHIAFGEAPAILAGDGLLALAFETIANGVETDIAGVCCLELARAAGPCQLVGGQFDDLDAEFSAGTLERLKLIHARKTGAMLVVSLRLGAIIGRANKEQLAAITVYGEKLGLAFQIMDDWLDVVGKDQELGKKAGKDADRGKLTFPAILGVDQSLARARELVVEACEAVGLLNENATGLKTLAQYVVDRRN